MNEKEKTAYIKGMQDLADKLTRYFERLGDKAYGPLVAYHIRVTVEDLKKEFERKKGENDGKQDDQGTA